MSAINLKYDQIKANDSTHIFKPLFIDVNDPYKINFVKMYDKNIIQSYIALYSEKHEIYNLDIKQYMYIVDSYCDHFDDIDNINVEIKYKQDKNIIKSIFGIYYNKKNKNDYTLAKFKFGDEFIVKQIDESCCKKIMISGNIIQYSDKEIYNFIINDIDFFKINNIIEEKKITTILCKNKTFIKNTISFNNLIEKYTKDKKLILEHLTENQFTDFLTKIKVNGLYNHIILIRHLFLYYNMHFDKNNELYRDINDLIEIAYKYKYKLDTYSIKN